MTTAYAKLHQQTGFFLDWSDRRDAVAWYEYDTLVAAAPRNKAKTPAAPRQKASHSIVASYAHFITIIVNSRNPCSLGVVIATIQSASSIPAASASAPLQQPPPPAAPVRSLRSPHHDRSHRGAPCRSTDRTGGEIYAGRVANDTHNGHRQVITDISHLSFLPAVYAKADGRRK